MNHCPVRGCGTLIHPDAIFCHDDWMRLPQWARDDLDRLRRTQPDSELYRRTVEVALTYLNEQGAGEPMPAQVEMRS